MSSTSFYECSNPLLIESFTTNVDDEQKAAAFKRFQPTSENYVVMLAMYDNHVMYARLIPTTHVKQVIGEQTIKAHARKATKQMLNVGRKTAKILYAEGCQTRLRRRASNSVNKNEPVLVTMNGQSKYVSTNDAKHSKEDFLKAIQLAAKLGNERLKSLASD